MTTVGLLLLATVMCGLQTVVDAQLTPNQNPQFQAGTNVLVVEDSGSHSSQWATAISDGEGAGGANAGVQSLRFTVIAADTSLFSRQPAIDTATGFLTFTPARDAFGNTQVSVKLTDSGTATCVTGTTLAGTAMGPCPSACSPSDCSSSATRTFAIIIQPVNDCPSFNILGDQNVQEDSGQSSVVGFANTVSRGATNENAQTLNFQLTATDTSLFSVQPTIAWNANNPTAGTLTFTPAANLHGTSAVSISVTDNGGTTNSGCDQSTTQTFSIIINSVNDAPTFTMGQTPVVVLEDVGAVSQPGWASGMIAGPANEQATQTVSFNLQLLDATVASLFTVQPFINPNTGDLSFTTALDANTFARTVQVYVQLQDNANTGASSFSCFPITSCPILTIQITPVNDAASFVPGGDIRVFEDLLNYAVPPVPPIYSDGNAWATSISVGAENEGTGANKEGQEVIFRLTNDNSGLFDVQPAIDSRGTLTFQLAKDANGVAVVQVAISDNGAAPVTSQTATFQITVEEVNDAPSFVISHSNPIVINEDAGPQEIAIWATSVVAGPTLNENSQINRFVLEPTDLSFFSAQPTVALIGSNTGRLQFTTSPNRWGTTTVRVTLQDDGGTVRNGIDHTSQILTIIVNSRNDPPSFKVRSPLITVSESGNPVAYSGNGFGYEISAGGATDGGSSNADGDEGNNLPSVNGAQQVRFLLTVDNEHLFTTLPTMTSQGQLAFTPAANQFGDGIVTVIAQDDNMPPSSSAGITFTIRILPVNNAPTFSLLGDITGRQITMCQTTGSCTRTFASYVSGILAGPDVNEATQTVTFSATIPPAFGNIFDVPPAINSITGDLTFTLALNRFTDTGNPVPVTITGKDDGGKTNGGLDSTIKMITLEVQKQNTPPQFQPGANPNAVLEDSSLQTFTGWATAVQTGPLDTSTSGLSFRMKVADPTMFAEQPQITLDSGNTGTLTFRPQVNRYGATLVQITLDNSLNSQSSEQFTITLTITPVNDVPSFNGKGNLVVYESSGNYLSTWVNSVSPGPYEASQIITWAITCDALANTLFAVAPQVNSLGEMSWTLHNDQSGMTSCLATAQDNGGILDSGVDSASQRFNIDVKAINNAPSFTAGNDITILESPVGNGAHSILSWASNMNPGTGENSQILTFEVIVSSADAAMFTVPARIDATGTLTFTLAEGMNGNIFLDVVLRDNGGTNPADRNTSPVHRALLVVTPVNTAPRFTLGSNIAVLESSGLYRQIGFANGISAGPVNEAYQSLRFTLTASNPGLFALLPTLDPATGDLQFSTQPNTNGVSAIQVCLQDNGGTGNSGLDSTCVTTMSVSVVAVNTAPDAVIPTEVTILEDSGAFTVENFLTGVTAGVGSGENSQQISAITVTLPIAYQSLFKTQPRINMANYQLSFETVEDFYGTITCTVTIADNGGINNGGVNTKTATFDLIVLPVNDRPSFIKGPDISLFEDASRFQNLWAGSIISGPTNEASQSVVFSCINNMPKAFIQGGAPSIDTSGYLTFTLAPNVNGAVTVFVYLKDNGGVSNGGRDTSIAGISFVINIVAVNDKPFFVPGPAIIVNEDSNAYFYAGWASGINAGPSVEEQLSQRNLNFSVMPADPSYFTLQPSIQWPSGDLAWTLAGNKFGVTTLNVILTDNVAPVAATYSRVVSVTVNGVNDAPTFTALGDITVYEDAGDQIVQNFITTSSTGPAEVSQTVSYTVMSSDVLKFASPPRIVGKDLLYTTAADANGALTFVVNATDRAGGMNHWYAQTYNLNILPVNDPPMFTIGSDVTVRESSGTSRITNWLPSKVVMAGPPDESSQLLTPYWSVTPAGILSVDPLLDLNTNTLTIAVVPFRFGPVSVSLYYKDNGGVSNSGDDTSFAQTFTINVNPTNNNPTFTPGNPVIYVGGRTSSYSAAWASDISAGVFEDGSQTDGFSVSTDKTEIFIVRPAVSAAGVLTFVLSPSASGNATLSIILRDSNGGASHTVYVTIIVASYAGPDLIVITLSTPYENFVQAGFRTDVAEALGIQEDQVVIYSAKAGSTIVTFQLISKEGFLSSQELIRNFLTLCNSNTVFRTKINLVQVTVVPNSLGGQYRATPTPATPAKVEDGGFNWVALIIILVAVVALIAIIVCVVFAWRKRQEKKKTQQPEPKYVPTSAYGQPPTSGNMEQQNPVNEFNRQPASPYGTAGAEGGQQGSSPQLQQGRSNRWGSQQQQGNNTQNTPA